MSLRADAAADLAEILDDDDAGEAALWRPAGVGGGACRVTVGAAAGDLGLASGMGFNALGAIVRRDQIAAVTAVIAGTARDPQAGDVLSLTDPASAALGDWLVVLVNLDLLGGARLSLVPRSVAVVDGLGTCTALVVPSLDHLAGGDDGEVLEREADALIGGVVAPGALVVVADGDAAGSWAVVSVAARDGGLYRCRLRWRTRTRSNDNAVRRVPR